MLRMNLNKFGTTDSDNTPFKTEVGRIDVSVYRDALQIQLFGGDIISVAIKP